MDIKPQNQHFYFLIPYHYCQFNAFEISIIFLILKYVS